jgi:hypothetical protein
LSAVRFAACQLFYSAVRGQINKQINKSHPGRPDCTNESVWQRVCLVLYKCVSLPSKDIRNYTHACCTDIDLRHFSSELALSSVRELYFFVYLESLVFTLMLKEHTHYYIMYDNG